MKKRLLIGLGGAALCAAALALFLCVGRAVPLGERYPLLSEGSYRAALLWSGMEGEAIDAAVSDEEFQDLLSSVRVTKGPETHQAPEVELLIHLFHGSDSYSISVGADRTLSVAQLNDLAGTRTFWKDRDGQLFSALYACHLKNGGEALPPQLQP